MSDKKRDKETAIRGCGFTDSMPPSLTDVSKSTSAQKGSSNSSTDSNKKQTAPKKKS